MLQCSIGTPILELPIGRGSARSSVAAVMSKKPKTVFTLERDDCRLPIGDPRQEDFHFCGAQALAGKPYCQHHWQMAFQPARPRDARSAAVVPSRRAA